MTSRCWWPGEDPLYIAYHDEEWGVPVHDDRTTFEYLTLEGAQAGLSWQTVLNKREGYRAAFDNFDPAKVAAYTDADTKRLLADAGIVRNRAKIASTINNAQRFLEVQKEFGTFDRYIWQFTGYKTIRMHGEVTWDRVPTQTKDSRTLSKNLQSRRFKFVGPTICYAHIQAIGMVNNHISSCFRSP